MSISASLQRDSKWLLSRLDHIWSNYFPEMTQDNPIFIKFGKHSKFRLGSIRMVHSKSLITITAMFKKLSIPQEVVDHTIAHELVHYSHGFSSKKPRLHKYPHAGGIVQKEMKRRGMIMLIHAYKRWIKKYRIELEEKEDVT
ncbi:hypothetical protein HYW42_03250 [Candidatus Daviesbacteria bacterium]|nr:hypothetical protein [Candidatus Daviesbacteria bacterium]